MSYCFYCCHPSKHQMYGLPIHYHETTNTFTFYGKFCSWECMKSYNLYSNSSFRQNIFNYIQLFHDKIHDDKKIIQFAPPKTMLNVFGGPLSIDEFRRNNEKFNVYESPMKYETQLIEKYENFAINQSQQSYNNSEIVNEPIKLKRKMPKQSAQNTLEKSMGVFKST